MRLTVLVSRALINGACYSRSSCYVSAAVHPSSSNLPMSPKCQYRFIYLLYWWILKNCVTICRQFSLRKVPSQTL